MGQTHWELIGKVSTGIWAVIGPFIGVLVGAYIANQNQRKHWVADNKKREYQELITALILASDSVIRQTKLTVTIEERRELVSVEQRFVILIATLIFIRNEVMEMKIGERWEEMNTTFANERNTQKLGETLSEIRRDLLNAAGKIIGFRLS